MLELLDAVYALLPEDQATLVNVVWALLKIQTIEQFVTWTQTELQSILPHGALICGVGYINRPTVQMIEHISVNFPMAYMQDIRLPDGGVLSPVMDRWLKENKPQLFDPAHANQEVHQKWMAIFNKHDLRNIAAHGMHCNSKPVCSYFNFSRIPGPLGPRHAYLLEFLVPQMHSVLTRILLKKDFVHQISPHNLSSDSLLTQREKEILHWMSEGKSNNEIADFLILGKETIKSHVKKILKKLKSKNRTEAIRRAIEMGFIEFRNAPKRVYSRHDD